MAAVLVTIWVMILIVLDVMLFGQIICRAIHYFKKDSVAVDWTGYNRILLTLMAVAFFPVTLAWLYITRT